MTTKLKLDKETQKVDNLIENFIHPRARVVVGKNYTKDLNDGKSHSSHGMVASTSAEFDDLDGIDETLGMVEQLERDKKNIDDHNDFRKRTTIVSTFEARKSKVYSITGDSLYENVSNDHSNNNNNNNNKGKATSLGNGTNSIKAQTEKIYENVFSGINRKKGTNSSRNSAIGGSVDNLNNNNTSSVRFSKDVSGATTSNRNSTTQPNVEGKPRKRTSSKAKGPPVIKPYGGNSRPNSQIRNSTISRKDSSINPHKTATTENRKSASVSAAPTTNMKENSLSSKKSSNRISTSSNASTTRTTFPINNVKHRAPLPTPPKEQMEDVLQKINRSKSQTESSRTDIKKRQSASNNDHSHPVMKKSISQTILSASHTDILTNDIHLSTPPTQNSNSTSDLSDLPDDLKGEADWFTDTRASVYGSMAPLEPLSSNSTPEKTPPPKAAFTNKLKDLKRKHKK